MSASAVHTRTGLVRKGRHRKPVASTTGKTIAKTVVAGAVVGTPLATVSALTTPGTAQAASDTVWDRVAKCESGGNWSINTGNGFRGGLQFTSSTWRGFGGTQFASSAEKASREQQIVVAEKVLSKQGWGAWPVCSRKAKATGQSATLRIAPGKPKGSTAVTTKAVGTKTIGKKAVKPTPVATVTGRHALKPSGPNPLASPPPSVTSQPELAPGAPPPTPILQVADRVQQSVTPHAPGHELAKPGSAHASAAPPPAPAPAVPAPVVAAPVVPAPVVAAPVVPAPVVPAPAVPAPVVPAAAPAPAVSGPAAPAPRIPTPRRSPESVHAPSAPKAPAPAAVPAPAAAPAPAAPRTYQVRAGDTLVGIARSQAVTGGWKSIYDANRGTLTDANRIRPGQKLTLS